MSAALSEQGAAGPELCQQVPEIWLEAAFRAGHDVSGFDPASSLEERLEWAIRRGLDIGAILSRFSSKMQHSTEAQVHECLQGAAVRKIYVPPEYICIDEGVSGRKAQRIGLKRMEAILRAKLARVLLVFKVSRLFRSVIHGFKFLDEEVVEKGLRAISVSQGIDTDDKKVWKQLCYLHGMMDEMLLESIADHVRSGIANLFRSGFTVGALPVGYRAEEVPGGRPTNRGRPRTKPAVDPAVAAMIVQHFQWIRDGLPLRKGWRRWVDAKGACDPRSTTGRMTYPAYRRMLSNRRYTGVWAFGRKRNRWLASKDYTGQEEQPESQVTVIQCDELRIVDDDDFFAVQDRLHGRKRASRGPRRRKSASLWDLVTGCFVCAACSTPEEPVRFYQAGANGHGMRCRRGPACPCSSIVNREVAVRQVLAKLTELLQQDTELTNRVVSHAQAMDAAGDEPTQERIAEIERQLVTAASRIKDLLELAGEGTDEDRAETKAQLRTAQHKRAALQAEMGRLRLTLDGARAPLTPERVQERLADLTALLTDLDSEPGNEDRLHRAAAVFELLVGGRIDVHVETRAGRKTSNVRGSFVPQLLRGLGLDNRNPQIAGCETPAAVDVWLRQPPRKDLLSGWVHRLIDEEGHSFRSATHVLVAQGHRLNSGVVWQIYHRYWEMQGLPAPKQAYNAGRPRRARSLEA